ncbi:F-box/kelch-repeat protein At1g23390-like [Chenopodium quinoa]|uniref:F-box domain-containing protein n=1 Tax=Chenopodium quinoa TaxID=63459 RepID=A0A803LJD0_CHEQI|nr:F-box/kelch-repeat protein At1g23390-like [Chenopodium quinoa]
MKEQRGEGSPIHGDLLEEVFARVPLIDLACASHVSKSWEFSVSSSLVHINKPKPWLIIQTQNTTSLTNKNTTYAYDPRSNTWVELVQPSNHTKHVKPLQSSGSSLFYELSSERLSFSVDPLHHTWHHISSPGVWRVDPIVAVVGPHLIVAGGGAIYWDNPLTVKMYDMTTSHWSTCQSMPSILKDSTASTWLSVASNQHKMYVTEKASGITYSFSPDTKAWSGPYDLRPDPSVYFSAIGYAGDDLILAGLIGNAENVKNLKLWKINPETMESNQIGEIPAELLEKLQGENSYLLSSINILATESLIYLHNTSDPSEIIFCELNEENNCKWGSVKNIILNDNCKVGSKLVMSCGRVGIADLHTAMKSRNIKFVEKS